MWYEGKNTQQYICSPPLPEAYLPLSISSGVFANAVSGTPAWGDTAGLCSAGDPATHPDPKNHFHLSHKKSLLKNKVLPSFLYNSGKQSSALYAGTVRLDSDTSFAESCTT